MAKTARTDRKSRQLVAKMQMLVTVQPPKTSESVT